MNNYITEKEKIHNLIVTDKFQDISMERIKFIEKRLYASKEPFKVYSGLTGALDAATFKGNRGAKRLGKWRDKMRAELGVEGQEAYLNSMADFGTLTHECLVRIKKNGYLDWQDEQDYATQFFENSAKKNGITPNFNVIRSQVFEYNKAAASLLQFVYDNVIEIYAIETMAKSDELQIATPIDLVCKVKEKKGERIVSLNIKTSEQFGAHHWDQVAVEMYLWNNTYPDFQVDATGLLRPKDWNQKKGMPTYEYELLEASEQTKLLQSIAHRLRICLVDSESSYMNFPTELPSFSGITKAGEAPKIITKTLEEIYNEYQESILA
jgi:hypothetical protein